MPSRARSRRTLSSGSILASGNCSLLRSTIRPMNLGMRGRRAWSGALIVLVLAGACAKGKSDAEQASAALAAGLKAHAAGRLDEAASDYRKVLVYDPRNKFAYYNLGVIEQAQGDDGSAESNYRIALT